MSRWSVSLAVALLSIGAAAPPAAAEEQPAKNAPHVRAVRWICEEQDCEGYPVFAYDYLPAVSADGRFVAHVEERDGWGHSSEVGVRVVSTESGASVAFFSVVAGARNMDSMKAALARKAEFQALVDAANAGLAPFAFRPLFPRTSSADCGSGRPGAPACARSLVPELAIDVWSKDDQGPRSSGIAKVVVRQGGKELANVSAKDWDPGSGCSTRAFELLGARADAHVAVFVSNLVMTGHNCDGVKERQPWPVRVVRW
ncbi:MAG TPA: hypothetical protein VLT33_20490 [Labilithrix sp.]|nr:hypothetical protein [Labilithrix sp.]